ncbi:hypothetical protein ACROYT_G044387 [Oculina patagonica]
MIDFSVSHGKAMTAIKVIPQRSSFIHSKTTMSTTKKNKPPTLVLQQENVKKSDELEAQKSNSNIQSLKDMDKLSNLKPPVSPLTKKWFRKQFGIRKGMAQLEDGSAPQTINTTSFQKSRRRSSSLPDLAAMLDAASLKRHASLRTRSPGPLRMATARKEPILTK